jgi:hypothetical protein
MFRGDVLGPTIIPLIISLYPRIIAAFLTSKSAVRTRSNSLDALDRCLVCHLTFLVCPGARPFLEQQGSAAHWPGNEHETDDSKKDAGPKWWKNPARCPTMTA